jgi:hypothetical protein
MPTSGPHDITFRGPNMRYLVSYPPDRVYNVNETGPSIVKTKICHLVHLKVECEFGGNKRRLSHNGNTLSVCCVYKYTTYDYLPTNQY